MRHIQLGIVGTALGALEEAGTEFDERPFWLRELPDAHFPVYLFYYRLVKHLNAKSLREGTSQKPLVVEIGSGQGTSALHFAAAGARVVSVDVNRDALHAVQRRAETNTRIRELLRSLYFVTNVDSQSVDADWGVENAVKAVFQTEHRSDDQPSCDVFLIDGNHELCAAWSLPYAVADYLRYRKYLTKETLCFVDDIYLNTSMKDAWGWFTSQDSLAFTQVLEGLHKDDRIDAGFGCFSINGEGL